MTLPIQPIILDKHGSPRFRENKIVRYLLDHGGIDLNRIAVMNFPQEDQEQFAQLIGYSLSGFAELSYASDETFETAEAMFQTGKTETEARIEYLEGVLSELRIAFREPMARLYGKHPDDFMEEP